MNESSLKNHRDSFVYLFLISVSFLSIDYYKPIFIDEFLNYAFTLEKSFNSFFKTLTKSIQTVNHGQTGVFTIVNYISFSIFSPSQIILRLPSYFALLFTILISTRILLQFDRKKISPYIFILVYINSGYVNDYFNLSRSYSFLILAFVILTRIFQIYFNNANSRKELNLLLIFLLLINTFHPYIILYNLIFVAMIFFVELRKKIRTLPLLILLYGFAINAAISLFIGLITWMNRTEKFELDPYFYLPKVINPFVEVYLSQFYFMILPITIILILSSVITFIIEKNSVINVVAKDSHTIKFMIYIFLISLIIISLTAGISKFNGYWIMPKQWVSVSFGMIIMFSLGISFLFNKYVDRLRLALVIIILINVLFKVLEINNDKKELLIEFSAQRCKEIQSVSNTKQPTNKLWEDIGTCDLIVLKKASPVVSYFYE